MPRFLANGLVVINARVGVSSAYREFCDKNMEPFRPEVEAIALIDTGASVSCVDRGLVEKLCIRQKDSIYVSGFSGASQEYPTYDVWLKIVNRSAQTIIEDRDLRVVGTDLSTREYKVIIGMDLLHCFTLKLLHVADFVELCETPTSGEPVVG